MTGNVLVLGASRGFPETLGMLIPGITVRSTHTASETEGLGADVIFVAGEHPFDELTEIRVHPNLYATPVVLYCPGHKTADQRWQSMDVWPVTRDGFDGLDELIEHVADLLSRHASAARSADRTLHRALS